MKLLEGKNALIFGIANDHSIAWGIAQAMHAQGARMAFSYSSPALERRVRPLAEKVDAVFIEKCDVSRDEEIEAVFARTADELGTIDILVHDNVEFVCADQLGQRQAHRLSRRSETVQLDIRHRRRRRELGHATLHIQWGSPGRRGFIVQVPGRHL